MMRVKARGVLITLAMIVCLAGSAQLLAQSTSDVQFHALAVNFPLGKEVKLKLRGTTRYSHTKGAVEVQHKGGHTKISLHIKDLDAPSQKQYTTYVVWAVSPEGLADNLGEYRPRKTRTPWPIRVLPGAWGGPMTTTTRFRTFSIVITAEPHFLVTSPSRQVVASNLPPEGKFAGLEVKQVAVNFRGDIGLESVPWREDHVALAKDLVLPGELLQARRAMDMAQFLQVEKYAQTEFKAARETMADAEEAYVLQQPEQATLLARRAIRQFELARQLNQERLDAQLKRQKELELADVSHQLELTEKDAARAKALLKEVTAESEEKDRQLKQARAATDDLTARLQRLDAQLEEAIRAERRAEQQVAGAEERAAAAESRAQEATEQLNRMRATSISTQEHRFKLRLARLAETYYNDEVFVVVLFNKDVFEERDLGPAAVLSESGKQKLDVVAESMLAYPDAVCGITAHIDGLVDVSQQSAETYSTTVTAYLLSKGVPGDRLKPVSEQPSVVRSRRVTGQGNNSRVELIFVNRPQPAGASSTS